MIENKTFLFNDWSEMSTAQLDVRLQRELKKENPEAEVAVPAIPLKSAFMSIPVIRHGLIPMLPRTILLCTSRPQMAANTRCRVPAITILVRL